MSNPDTNSTTAPAEANDTDLTAADLIEEVSIDGMCGVY
ncbi:mycofactocin precursor MftA [Nocardioides ultimimeridianus]